MHILLSTTTSYWQYFTEFRYDIPTSSAYNIHTSEIHNIEHCHIYIIIASLYFHNNSVKHFPKTIIIGAHI